MDTDPQPSGSPAGRSFGKPSGSAGEPGRRGRKICWLLCALSLATVVISGYFLAQRIARYNTTAEHPLFAYIPISSTPFTFAGRPVDVTQETIEGGDVLVVRYGDEQLVLDVAIPPLQPIPDLFERHKDWMTMNIFADRSGMTLGEFSDRIAAGDIEPRLGIVTRTPFGVEPPRQPRFESIEQEKNQSSADVHREQWRFDCYEFNRDGSITHQIKHFPESGVSLLRRQNDAKLHGRPIPQREAGELEEYTWEYGAALKTMPRAPAITMEKQALRNSGWTLPVTSAAFLLLVVSFFFAIAPERVRS